MSFGRPERPPSEFVPPDEYRSEPLPDRVRQWIDRKAGAIAEAYNYAYEMEKAHVDDYQKEVARLLDEKAIRWWLRGSERTVAGLGRTHQGVPIVGTWAGVVVKFNAWLRPVDWMDGVDPPTVEVLTEAGNLFELAMWRYANDHGDANLFAKILDFSDHGDWLAMEACIPVYPGGSPFMQKGQIDYINEKRVDEYWTARISEAAEAQGYDPHLKDGNIGIRLSDMNPVMVDYGAHTKIDDVRLTDWTLDQL